MSKPSVNDSNEQTLLAVATHLDISPSDFERATARFSAVREWLERGLYLSGAEPKVYLQGSFRHGTVVRPYRDDKDAAFDIDQVCELSAPSEQRSPSQLKRDIGDRLKENADYRRMLDAEGKRCWTIEYASEESRPGFHLDILPAIPSKGGGQAQIDITDKTKHGYKWSPSNPQGYYHWFKSRNPYSVEMVTEQRRQIFDGNKDLYAAPDVVPKRLVRTALQRGIQIMKRHRDVYFAKRSGRPISILITTIAAHQEPQPSILGTLRSFVDYVIGRHAELIEAGVLLKDGIMDFDGVKWVIPNPVTFGENGRTVENFADKWSQDSQLVVNFFQWVYQLDRDISRFDSSGMSDELQLRIKQFGSGSAFAGALRQQIDDGISRKTNETNRLLALIHLAIEGRVDWDYVAGVAESVFNVVEGSKEKDIAKVNYYQVGLHRGRSLSREAAEDVRSVLSKYPNDPDFDMCIKLLLGEETRVMVAKCLASREDKADVLKWPIMRLAKIETLYS